MIIEYRKRTGNRSGRKSVERESKERGSVSGRREFTASQENGSELRPAGASLRNRF